MKKMKMSMIAAALVLSTITVNPAHALIGAVIFDAPMVLAGLALSLFPLTCSLTHCGPTASNPVAQAALGGAGIALLGDDGARELLFSPISADDAQKLDISSQQMSAYNSELDELNLASRAVDADLSKNPSPTAQDSQAAWAQYASQISPDALAAAQKVAVGAEKASE
jgi:hypothetical protein